ncbi:nuclear transport factor 2 family protein [Nocardia sp. XZ_19_385]|uniref:nuclear transport factor 2 family protein n=1 Tax=Nocardia sp. XZ_19_385 TaxID=2769488 RepID=UPI00188E14BA|nr:nuclear transport factor 2 family protein [Nocardia sp. XZ_19_385]
MALNPTAEALLAAVLASPRAVAAHDKSAWVNLFTADAEVNDPVGSRPHVGRAAIERFYDTFIAPNGIAFDVAADLVGGHSVVRDLYIETTMSTGAMVRVPMHLRYDLAALDGDWKIVRLAAHWEFPAMVTQLMLRTGVRGLTASAKLGPQLIANQGLGGTFGMMRAIRSVGKAGKTAVTQLFSAAAATDIGRVRTLLDDSTVLQLPAGSTVSVEEFTNRTRNMRWDKLIAAGRTVSISVELDGAPGVAFVDFAASSHRIDAITVFLDENA